MAGTIVDNAVNVLGASAAFYRSDEPARGLTVEFALSPDVAYYGDGTIGHRPALVVPNQSTGAFSVSLPANATVRPSGSKYIATIIRHGKRLVSTDGFVVLEGETHSIGDLVTITGSLPGPEGPPGPVDRLLVSVSNTNYTIPANVGFVRSITNLTAARTFTLPRANLVQPGDSVLVWDQHGSAGTFSISVTCNAADTIPNGLFLSIRAIDTAYGWEEYISDGVSKWFGIS